MIYVLWLRLTSATHRYALRFSHASAIHENLNIVYCGVSAGALAATALGRIASVKGAHARGKGIFGAGASPPREARF